MRHLSLFLFSFGDQDTPSRQTEAREKYTPNPLSADEIYPNKAGRSRKTMSAKKKIFKPQPVSGFPEWLPEVRAV
ncbi:MAG: hypothetical protein KDI90_02225, partial [Alphaproteobacteria bacterium]|nr:hypothetical protein [Alphaproteobacteria bacterium]